MKVEKMWCKNFIRANLKSVTTANKTVNVFYLRPKAEEGLGTINSPSWLKTAASNKNLHGHCKKI